MKRISGGPSVVCRLAVRGEDMVVDLAVGDVDDVEEEGGEEIS